MVLDAGSVLISLTGLFLLYVVCRIFLKPLKWLVQLAFSSVLGGVVIALLNACLGALGWHLALNPLNAMFVGVLGLPGLILIKILTLIL